MPNEFRFDDLDLREEPAYAAKPDDSEANVTKNLSSNCTRSQECTLGCTDACC